MADKKATPEKAKKVDAKAPAKSASKKGTKLDDAALDKISGGGNPTSGDGD